MDYGEHKLTEPMASAAVFGAQRTRWAPIIALRTMDRDPWKVASAAALKVLLDRSFPIPDLSLSAVTKGLAIARESLPTDIEIDLASVRHLGRIVDGLPAPTCCIDRDGSMGGWSLLALMQSLVETRIGKSFYRLAELQGQADRAAAYAELYASTMEGHPVIALARALAAIGMVEAHSDTAKAAWESKANRALVLALMLAHGQGRQAWYALSMMGAPPAGMGLPLMKAYSYDYPQHAYWSARGKGLDVPLEQQQAMTREAFAYSRNDLRPLDPVGGGLAPDEIAKLVQGLGDRFEGSPGKSALAASLRKPSGPESADEALTRLREAVSGGTRDFVPYLQLGDAEIRTNGRYEAASQAFLRFPGFHDKPPADPVADSRYAEMCGTRLYALGRPELAKPFYKISAGLNTGAEVEYISSMRLQVAAGDVVRAAETAHGRALQYPDSESYRDYLSFLHLFGHRTEAWQAFSQVNASFDDPEVWISALVGHRHDGLTDTAVRQWLLQPHIRDAHFGGRRMAPYFAMIWYTSDRVPPKDIGDLINQLEWPNGARMDADGFYVVRPSSQRADALEYLQPSELRTGPPLKLAPGTPVRSEFAMFADAYAAIKRGEFHQALDAFLVMAQYYPIELGRSPPAYALPYAAYAAAQSGDPTGVEMFVNKLQVGPAFDIWLSKAFFAAARKDSAAAEAALNSALREKLFAQIGVYRGRPTIPDYQYAEACEWVYEATHDRRFVRMLLDWVRRYQRIEPIVAWAYAMEYQYTSDPSDRVRALAMTTYLDRRSPRIKSASKADSDAAADWLKTHNPFRASKDQAALTTQWKAESPLRQVLQSSRTAVRSRS